MALQGLLILGYLVSTSIALTIPKSQRSDTREKQENEFPEPSESREVKKYFDFRPAIIEGGVLSKDNPDTPGKAFSKKYGNGFDFHEREGNASSTKHYKKDVESRKGNVDAEVEKGEKKLASDRIYGTGLSPGYANQPPYWRNDYDAGINSVRPYLGPEYGRSYLYLPGGIPDLYDRGYGYNGGVYNRDGYGIYNGRIFGRDGNNGYGYNGYGYNGLPRDGYGLAYPQYPGNERGYYLGSDGLINNGYGYRQPYGNGLISRNPGYYGGFPSRDTGYGYRDTGYGYRDTNYGLYPDDRNGLFGSRPYNDRVNYSDPISVYLYGRGSGSNGRDLYGNNPSSGRGLYDDNGSRSRSKIKATEVDSKHGISPSEEVKSVMEVDPFPYGIY